MREMHASFMMLSFGVALLMFSGYLIKRNRGGLISLLGGTLICILSSWFFYTDGYYQSKGLVYPARDYMAIGDTYELMTNPVQETDRFYAIIKIDDEKIKAVWFPELPPKKGVMVRDKEGKIVFLPISDTTQKVSEKQ